MRTIPIFPHQTFVNFWTSVNMFKLLFALLFVLAIPMAASAQSDSELYEKCSVTVSWSRNGEDATVTVTVKNNTKYTLHDPVVRVAFFDKEGNELAADAKAYFKDVPPRKSKRMEARIWDLVPENAVKQAKGTVVGGYFE